MSNPPVFKFALSESLTESCKGTEFKPTDFLPTRATPVATGWDVRCAEKLGLTLEPGCYYKINLGFCFLPPEGWWCELKPRSSTFIKKNLHALYGTIDSDFNHNFMFICQYNPDSCLMSARNKPMTIEFGERIGQLIPVKLQDMIVKEVTLFEISAGHAERATGRDGGLGSTGDK